MNRQKITYLFIVFVLILSNIFFAVKYFEQKRIGPVQDFSECDVDNEKILNFANLFVGEVLKSDGEVDFETRLQLENAVRDLNNDKILQQWQKFTGSQTEEEAQTEVRELLKMIMGEIK